MVETGLKLYQPAVPAALKGDPALLVVEEDAGAVTEPDPLPPDDAGFPNKDPPEDDAVVSPAALAVVAVVTSVFSKELKLGAPAEPPKTEDPEPKTEDVAPAAEVVDDVVVAAVRPTSVVNTAVGLSTLAKNPAGGEPV